MPIDTTHAEYATIAARAQRMRDAIAGQEAVHARTTAYLPELLEQTPAGYAAMLRRAGWYGATGRTHEGLVGMVFRVAPVFDGPTALDELRDDVDLAGNTVDKQAQMVLGEMLGVARVGVLVEFPIAQTDGTVTQAQAEAQNLRPYATIYQAESIINWRVERVNNAMRATLIVLREVVCRTDPNDPYATEEIEQYRALRLVDGRYTQEVHRKLHGPADGRGNPTTQWEVTAFTPLMNGAPLDEIPFVVFGPLENSLRMQQPPLQQLADVNFGHYLNTADLEHGAHFTGLPTPWISGYQPGDGEKVALGSEAALCFPSPDAKAGFMEFTGTGLAALETRCEKKEQQMAALGARMLAPEKAGVEAGQTLAMRHTGESSVLANMALLVSAGMQQVLEIMARWSGVNGELKYQLNTDFMPAGLTAQELAELVKAWQSGAISWQTFFENLKRGEIITGDVTADEERERIAADGPTPSMQESQAALDAKAQQPAGGDGGGQPGAA